MNKKLLVTFIVAGAAAVFSMTGCGQNGGSASGEAAKEVSSYVDDPSKYIKLGEYKGLTYSKTDVEVTDEEIEGELQYLQSQYATVEQITDRAVADGDTVSCSYVGKIDGVAFDGGTGTTDALTIGSHSFIDDFEEQMIGMKPGETRIVEVTFPESYGKEELNGKDATFEVTLNYIAGKEILPEITDAFISENTEYATVDDYKAYVRDYIKEYKENSALSSRQQELWQKAVDNAEIIEYPEGKIEEEKKALYDNYQQYADMYGVELDELLEMMETNKEDFDKEAVTSAEGVVKRKLMFYAIMAAEKINLTDDEYKQEVADIVTEYGYESSDALEEEFGVDNLREELLWRKVLDVIVSTAVEE